MWADYCFLIEVPDAFLDEDGRLEEAAEHVEEAFDARMEERMAGNDGCGLSYAVFDDGRMALYDEESKAGLSGHQKAMLNQRDKNRWEEALDGAVQAAAISVHLYGASGINVIPDSKETEAKLRQDRKTLLRDIERLVGPEVRDVSLRRPKFADSPDDAAFHAAWRLWKLARAFRAVQTSSIPPFTTLPWAPPDCRAFDLRANKRLKRQRLAILVARIHT